MDSGKKYTALVQLGWYKGFFEGNDFHEIFDQITRFQDFGCLIRQSQCMSTLDDATEVDRMENWVERAHNEDCDMHHFDEMSFNLSIGNIKCYGWAQGEDECKILKTKFKEIDD